MWKKIIILLFVSTSCCKGLKIFGSLTFGTHSHFAIGDAILKTLWKAGHEITVMSPYPQKVPLENYRDISTADTLVKFRSEKLQNGFDFRKFTPFDLMNLIYSMGDLIVDTYMTHPKVKELISSHETFDICMFENFNAEAMLGLADAFNCSLISYTTFVVVTWTDEMTSNRSPMSYVPHPFLSFTEKMNFYQRAINAITFMVEEYNYHIHHLPKQKSLYEKYFPNAKKSFHEMLKSSAIIFANTHVSISSARPLLPSMIDIGGIHINEPKSLPSDIENFLESAENGVILFSMGSVIQANKWPISKREAFVNTFRKLKQKIIWKYENETLPNKPDNVYIDSWIPQRDILHHPNIKLFITHGGYLSTTEAAYEGIQTLGIPVYGDQMMNMAKVEARGCGIQIMYEDISEEKLTEAINELLNNPKYNENAKITAKKFKDRPLTPQEEVVFWTEFVARNEGAQYLRAAGNDLSFFQFYLLDVYFAFLLALGIVLIGLLWAGKIAFSKLNFNDKKKKL